MPHLSATLLPILLMTSHYYQQIRLIKSLILDKKNLLQLFLPKIRCLSWCSSILVSNISLTEEITAAKGTPDSCSVAPSPMVLILTFEIITNQPVTQQQNGAKEERGWCALRLASSIIFEYHPTSLFPVFESELYVLVPPVFFWLSEVAHLVVSHSILLLIQKNLENDRFLLN